MVPKVPKTSRTSPELIILFFSNFLLNSLDPPTCLICPCLVSGLFLRELLLRNSNESNKKHRVCGPSRFGICFDSHSLGEPEAEHVREPPQNISHCNYQSGPLPLQLLISKMADVLLLIALV